MLLLHTLPALRRWAEGGYERQDTPADRVGEVSCRSIGTPSRRPVVWGGDPPRRLEAEAYREGHAEEGPGSAYPLSTYRRVRLVEFAPSPIEVEER